METQRLLAWAKAAGALLLAGTILPSPAWGKKLPKPAAAETVSHVRIVRLSLVSGPVQVRYPGGAWRRGLLNAPVTEGETIRTGANARAEIELEDGSTVRLIPNSEARFSRLALRDKVRLTTIAGKKGTLFFNLLRKHTTRGFELRLQNGEVTTPYGKGEFRAEINHGAADVLVLKGHINLVSGGLPYKLHKNDRLSLVPDTAASLASDKVRGRWDHWNHQRNQALVARNLHGFNAPFEFGLAELANYGSWNGSCWMPMGMGLGWNPYMNGNWYFDPAMGYVWDSFYPWGWLPYHFGAWMMGAGGWCWSPYNNFWGFAAMPVWYSTPGGAVLNPPKPPLKPPPPPPPPVSPIHKRVITASAGGKVGAKTGARAGASRKTVLARNSHNATQTRPHIPTRQEVSRMTQAQRAAWNRARSTVWQMQQEQSWRMGQQNRGRWDPYRAGGNRITPYRGGVARSDGASLPAPSAMPSPMAAPAARGGGGRIPH